MLTLALPKGRIYDDLQTLLARAGLAPAIEGEGDRRIMVESEDPGVRLIIVRASDVQTYVSYGTAQAGFVGRDMLLEKPVAGVLHGKDMGVSKCRLVVAASADFDYQGAVAAGRVLKVATKYPRLARRHFAAVGIQAEIVRLQGSMELAPSTGLADVLVDLVATGRTLAANRIVEVETIMDISTYLVFNQAAAWRRSTALAQLEQRLTG